MRNKRYHEKDFHPQNDHTIVREIAVDFDGQSRDMMKMREKICPQNKPHQTKTFPKILQSTFQHGVQMKINRQLRISAHILVEWCERRGQKTTTTTTTTTKESAST
jgi:hypothetical protein